MIDDAIKSIRSLFLVTLAIYLLWIVSWPSAVEKLSLYRETRDLTAWLYIKERLESLEADIFEYDADQPVSILEVEHPPLAPQGSEYIVRIPLEMATTWPNVAKYKFALEPVTPDPPNEAISKRLRLYLYRIRSDAAELPFEEYDAIILASGEKGNVFVVPRGDGQFAIESDRAVRILETGSSDPARSRSWDSIRPHLLKHGFDKPLRDLKTSTPALAKLQIEVDPRLTTGGVKVFGISLSIGAFFTSVGLFLAALGFALVGPLTTLTTAESRSHSQPWIMVQRRRSGRLYTVIEYVVLAISLIWAILPVCIIVLQFSTWSDLQGVGEWTLPISTVGLLISSAIYCLVAHQLWLCRKANN